MKRLINNIFIFFVAWVLLVTIGSFGLVYTIFWSIIHLNKISFLKYWADLVYTLNVGIDKIGNVLLGTFMNRFAITKPNYPFGKLEDTISYALAMNLQNLSPFGKFIVNILEKIDSGHMQDAIDRKA